MRINLLLSIFCCATLSQAQTNEWETTLVGTEKGLPHAWVHSVMRDKWGFNWIGTEDGLSRFDGIRLKTFKHDDGNDKTMTSNIVRDMTTAENGHFWLAINGSGLNLFDPNTGHTTNFPTPPHPISHKISTSGTSIATDKQGKVWIGFYCNGLYCFDPKTQQFDHFDLTTPEEVATDCFQKNSVNQLLLDKTDSNRLWVACNNNKNGLISVNTQTQKLTYHNITAAGMTVFKDENDCIWLGTWGNGLIRFDSKTQTHEAFFLNKNAFLAQNWRENVVRGIARKSKTELWVACDDKGLWIFDTQKRVFSQPANLPKLPATITRIMATDAKNIWLFSQEGVLYLREKPSLPLQKIQLPTTVCTDSRQAEVSDFAYDPLSKKTVASYADCDGIFVFDEKMNLLNRPKQVFDSIKSMNTLLLDADRVLWIGGTATPKNPFSLYHFDINTFVWQPVKYPVLINLDIHKSQIQDIIQSKNGDIWIANNTHGLIRFNPQSNTVETPLSPINPHKNLIINALKEAANGAIWAVSEYEGVIEYLPSSGKIRIFNHDLKRPNSFSEKGGNTIEEAADGTIWVGTDVSGVQIIDPQKPTDQEIRHLGLTDGLPNSLISKILRDNQNNIWVSTRNGMCVYEWAIKQIRRFNFGERVADFFAQGKGLYRNTEGSFFLGNVKGFTVFNPEKLLAMPRSNLVVHFTDLKVMGNPLPFEKISALTTPLSILPNQNLLTISFSTLEMLNSEHINYRYRLNESNDWINCGTQSELTFTDLPDGNHVFEVQCTNEDGIWQQNSSKLPIYIVPPFYRSFAFRAVCIVAFCGLALGFHRFRIRQIQEIAIKSDLNRRVAEAKIEALITQMNPHFIFNCLNSIQFLIQRGVKGDAMRYLTDFSQLMRSILESTRRGTISVEEEIKALNSYLALEKLRFKENLEFSIHIKPEMDTFGMEIPAMLIQPFAENALKHAFTDAQKVAKLDIQFNEEADFLIVTIRDNGKGMDEAKNTEGSQNRDKTSVGIALSRQRLALHNHREAADDLMIETIFGDNKTVLGTEVRLKIALSN